MIDKNFIHERNRNSASKRLKRGRPGDGIRGGNTDTPGEVLNFAVIYADWLAMEMARGILDRLSRCLHPEVSWWSFQQLRDERTAKQAAHSAAHADMIFCAMERTLSVPLLVKRWFQSWAFRNHTFPQALVALFRNRPGGDSPAHSPEDYFRRLAQSAGMDLFVKEINVPYRKYSFQAASRFRQKESFRTTAEEIPLILSAVRRNNQLAETIAIPHFTSETCRVTIKTTSPIRKTRRLSVYDASDRLP